MSRAKTDALSALIDQIRDLDVGEYTFNTEGGDSRTVEVSVRVTRRPVREENARYLEAALAHLSAMTYWPNSGDCSRMTTKTRSYSRYCRNAFAYVVVREARDYCSPRQTTRAHFEFVCAAHASTARLEKSVLAVIELPKYRLAPIRKAVEKLAAERRASEHRCEACKRFGSSPVPPQHTCWLREERTPA